MIAGIGHSLLARATYVHVMDDPDTRRIAAARERMEERQRALELAHRDPQLALEAGVGRPELRGAAHGGLVDLNHAAARSIARLPGVDDALARQIVQARDEVGGFASLEDLGALFELPVHVIEEMRPRVVCLPW